MSCVVDLSRISKCLRHKVRCTRVRSLNELNLMLKYKRVISVCHRDIGSIVVYYIEEKDDSAEEKYDSTADPRLTTWLGFPMA